MARRKKTSTFEDIVEVVAMLSWWVGVILAVVIYFWLHHIATQPIPPATDLKNFGANVGTQIWQTLATFGQYILPVACLMGAGLSAYGRYQRNTLHREVAHVPSRRTLEGMSWHQFEMLVGEVFRRKGFKVEERGGSGPDGGVDLDLRLGSDLYLVQCKQWKAMRVGVASLGSSRASSSSLGKVSITHDRQFISASNCDSWQLRTNPWWQAGDNPADVLASLVRLMIHECDVG